MPEVFRRPGQKPRPKLLAIARVRRRIEPLRTIGMREDTELAIGATTVTRVQKTLRRKVKWGAFRLPISFLCCVVSEAT
jgi:hypothetical protein